MVKFNILMVMKQFFEIIFPLSDYKNQYMMIAGFWGNTEN